MAYPTYLTYNPFAEEKSVAFNVGDKPVDLYDTLSHRMMASNAKNIGKFKLAGDTAAVIVLIPAGAREVMDGHKKLADGVVVDWNNGK